MEKMKIETNYGSTFDISDSIYLTAVGQRENNNTALSFYNETVDLGISYFVEPNMIVFQTEYDEDYWTKERIKCLETALDMCVNKEINFDEYNNVSLDSMVNIVLNEMDNYVLFVNEKYSRP